MLKNHETRFTARELEYDAIVAPAKVVKMPSGPMVDGYTKVKHTEDKAPRHLQMDSTRDSVGGKWPGPKGRVGKVLHGRASPSSPESFLKVGKSKEFQAK